MTDNDIIKALECCISGMRCNECCYQPKCSNMELGNFDILKDAFTIINRLEEKNANLSSDLTSAKAEIERLEKLAKDRADVNFAKIFTTIERASADIEAEAIKEFAERLRQCSYQSSDWSRGGHPMVVERDDIDDVLEEMVGERE